MECISFRKMVVHLIHMHIHYAPKLVMLIWQSSYAIGALLDKRKVKNLSGEKNEPIYESIEVKEL